MQTDIKKLLIEESVSDHPVTKRIMSQLPHAAAEVIGKSNEVIREYTGIDRDKTLLLARQRGRFVSKCPGTMGHICCNYYVLHNGINCVFDCSYCFLRFYGNSPFITVYVNREDLYAELDALCAGREQKPVRIGSGEFTDSLALEHITGEAADLIIWLRQHPGAMMELKTKSANVGSLLKCDPAPNVVIAWSLNPQTIIGTEEAGAASLVDRLSAARKCVEHGYRVAFHFDPIILCEEWEERYREVADALFADIDPTAIAWISMGTLRYHSALKQEIIRRNPESTIIYHETVTGKDGKIRYFKPLRVAAYRTILSRIRKYSSDVPVYLCMELPDVWEKVFGYYPDYANREDMLFFR